LHINLVLIRNKNEVKQNETKHRKVSFLNCVKTKSLRIKLFTMESQRSIKKLKEEDEIKPNLKHKGRVKQ